jgi:putative redox protein
MPSLWVNHLTDSAFLIDVRNHTLVIDEPHPKHEERGPTPIELFVAGLAGSVASTVVAYLREHYQPHDGVRVECEWRMWAGPPQRIEAIRIRVLLPQDPDRDTYLGIINAFNRCPVRAALKGTFPSITIELRSFAEWASLTAGDPIGRVSASA